jgi:hypothetical protein
VNISKPLENKIALLSGASRGGWSRMALTPQKNPDADVMKKLIIVGRFGRAEEAHLCRSISYRPRV